MSDWFTLWLLWLLGVEVPPTGEGVQWHLEGAWRWSRPVVLLMILIAVVSAAYVVYFYLRERSSASRGMRLLLTGFRLSLILLVLLVMIFELQLHFSRTSLPYLALAVDESASMDTVDDWDDEKLKSQLEQMTSEVELPTTSRLNAVKSLLLADDAALLQRLARRYTLRAYSVAASDRKLPSELDALQQDVRQLEATGESSQLGTGVRNILNDLRGTQPAALIMFTDGVTTQGPTLSEAANYVRRKAVPLYMVGIGSERKIRDLELADLLVDDIVFVNDYVDLDFKVTPHGLEDRVVEFVLKDKRTGEVLARHKMTAGKDGESQRERISHRPTKVGPVEYVIEVANLKEELKGKSPTLSRLVEVRDDPIRVLLVQSYPSFEFRYLKNLLERDRTIDFHVVLQEADLEYAEEDHFALRVFPVSREELFQYDVLILADVNLAYFSRTAMDNIEAFVKEKGGGMVIVSGERFNADDFRRTPLASLLPFDPDEVTTPPPDTDHTEGFGVRPTLLGITSPHMQLGDTRAETEAIWQGLSEIFWMLPVGKLKPGARVLAEHPSRTGSEGQKLPLIAIYYVPPGKVLWHGIDETWRWRFRVGDAIFARYWIQAVRHLSRAKLLGKKGVELAADRAEYQRGTPIQLRVRFFDERLAPPSDGDVTVVVEGTGPKKRRVTLQRNPDSPSIFSGSVGNLPVGNYTCWIAAPRLDKTPTPAKFKVVAPPGEAAQKEMNVADLKKAAKISRGRFYDVRNFDDLPGDLPRGRAVKVATLPPIPLWNNWRVLLLFVLLLTGEWLLRKGPACYKRRSQETRQRRIPLPRRFHVGQTSKPQPVGPVFQPSNQRALQTLACSRSVSARGNRGRRSSMCHRRRVWIRLLDQNLVGRRPAGRRCGRQPYRGRAGRNARTRHRAMSQWGRTVGSLHRSLVIFLLAGRPGRELSATGPWAGGCHLPLRNRCAYQHQSQDDRRIHAVDLRAHGIQVAVDRLRPGPFAIVTRHLATAGSQRRGDVVLVDLDRLGADSTANQPGPRGPRREPARKSPGHNRMGNPPINQPTELTQVTNRLNPCRGDRFRCPQQRDDHYRPVSPTRIE